MEQILYAEKTDGIAIDRIRREAAFTMPCKHLHNEYEIYYLLAVSYTHLDVYKRQVHWLSPADYASPL